MEGLADYFAICGLPDDPKLLDPSRGAPEDERARDIMDLAVVLGTEEAPEGFMPIDYTYFGARANLDQMQLSTLESSKASIFLAFRRRDHGELGPAISSIVVSGHARFMA